jgi:peptidoglycan/LPS O-acetylase OafA/YrhL
MTRFHVLDSLRGFAALCMALFHLQLANPVTGSAFVQNAFLMVDLFFVLSGFVISHTYFYRWQTDLRSFAAARLARLYPLHLYTLLVFLVFETLKYLLAGNGLMRFNSEPFDANNATSFLDNLLMLDSFPLLGSAIAWNYPSWSVSAEFWSNLAIAFAVFALAIGRLPAFLALAAVVLAGSFATLTALGIDLDTSGELGLVRCFYGFAIGMLAYAIHAATAARRYRGAAANLVELVVLAAFFYAVATVGDGNRIWLALLFAVVVLVFAREAGIVSKLLRARPCAYLGEISYSVYLNHAIVAAIVQRAAGTLLPAGDVPASLAATAFYLLVVLGYSHLTYRLIEAPWRARLKAWLVLRPAAAR